MAAIFSLKNLNQPRKHWQLLTRCRNKTEFGHTRGGFAQGKGHIPFMVSVKQRFPVRDTYLGMAAP